MAPRGKLLGREPCMALSISLPSEEWTVLDAYVKSRGLNRSSVVRAAIKAWLRRSTG